MTHQQIREAVVQSIRKVAPESKPERMLGDEDIREELDLDSMDFLNLVVALHDALAVDVAEKDYPRLVTLNSAIAYFEQRLASRAEKGS